MPRKQRSAPPQRSSAHTPVDVAAVVSANLPGIWGLALLAARWFVPAESAHLGETLWIVQLWLLTATVWSLFALLRRSLPPRLDWADAAVWLLVIGHVLSAALVLATEGQKRYALNMLWEWVGVGVAITLLRQWLRGAAGERQFVRVLATGAVVLAGLGLWQYGVEFPKYRGQLQELIQLEARFDDPEAALSGREQDRVRELQQQLGSLATEQDPVARYKLRQRLLDSTEPLGRFALANSLGGFLATGLVLLLGGVSAARQHAVSRWRMGFTLLAAGLVAYCLILTKSRTAWAGLLAGLIAWGLLTFGRQVPLRRVLFGSAVAGACGAALVLAAVWTGGLDRLVLTEAPKSLGYRWEYWSSSVRVIADAPLFGAGPGNFRQHYLRHKLPGSSEEVLDPHNQFLDVWACGGLLAVAGLGWIWLRCVRRFRRPGNATVSAPATGMSGWWVTAAGAAALLLVYAVRWSFEAVHDEQTLYLAAGWAVASLPLRDLEVLPTAMLAAALVLGVHLLGAGGIAMPAISVPLLLLLVGTAGEIDGNATPQQWPTGNRLPTVLPQVALLGILLATCGACLMTGLWPSYYARLLTAAGESAVSSRHDAVAARRDLEAATQVDPLDPEPWYALAGLEFSLVNGSSQAADTAFDRAMTHLHEAIRRDPYSPRLHWTAGQWLFARYQSTLDPALLAEALLSMDRSGEGYPHHAGIRALRAEVLAAAGRQEAVDEARFALRLDDLNLGRAHYDVALPTDVRERLQAIAAKQGTGVVSANQDHDTVRSNAGRNDSRPLFQSNQP